MDGFSLDGLLDCLGLVLGGLDLSSSVGLES